MVAFVVEVAGVVVVGCSFSVSLLEVVVLERGRGVCVCPLGAGAYQQWFEPMPRPFDRII